MRPVTKGAKLTHLEVLAGLVFLSVGAQSAKIRSPLRRNGACMKRVAHGARGLDPVDPEKQHRHAPR